MILLVFSHIKVKKRGGTVDGPNSSGVAVARRHYKESLFDCASLEFVEGNKYSFAVLARRAGAVEETL